MDVDIEILMNASFVSSVGKTITIECDDHDTKDAILNILTGTVTIAEKTLTSHIKNNPEVVARLLRSIAGGSDAKKNNQDNILIVAADMLENRK